MALPMLLAGEMVVHEGAAYLCLAPEAATAAASAPRGAAAAPGGPDLDAKKFTDSRRHHEECEQ